MAAAQEMVADLRSLPLLCGYRGRPKGDLGALARALVALSQLAHDDSILEAEINPLLVLPEGKGVVALDALVRLNSLLRCHVSCSTSAYDPKQICDDPSPPMRDPHVARRSL